MIKLSVVVITLNEEKRIRRCLDSVREVADEVVVVDSHSTDRTVEIARSYGAVVVEHTFEGYVKQKNFANSQASHDHILSLDADEVLSDELLASILQVKKQFDASGYTMNRMTNYAGKWVRHCGWYPDRKLRLFDRRRGKWEGVIIHEEFRLSDGSRPGHLKGDLLHYSFDSVADHRRQSEKFTTLGAEADFQKGKKAPVYKLLFAPVVKFLQSYIFRLGILDGMTGLTICRLSALATYHKYKKLRKRYRSSHA
jgi:glycosyltransferase involved in cell wall biosynthesis